MVARAWIDAAYKERMLADGRAAARDLGIPVTEAAIVALEKTPRRHNLIVCTLCSCYPRSLLGEPPAEIRVHDSNADMRYIVLPMRPAGTEGLTEEQLAVLVTRDCLVGAALPRPPAER